mgnify:CR=1 FL=1
MVTGRQPATTPAFSSPRPCAHHWALSTAPAPHAAGRATTIARAPRVRADALKPLAHRPRVPPPARARGRAAGGTRGLQCSCSPGRVWARTACPRAAGSRRARGLLPAAPSESPRPPHAPARGRAPRAARGGGARAGRRRRAWRRARTHARTRGGGGGGGQLVCCSENHEDREDRIGSVEQPECGPAGRCGGNGVKARGLGRGGRGWGLARAARAAPGPGPAYARGRAHMVRTGEPVGAVETGGACATNFTRPDSAGPTAAYARGAAARPHPGGSPPRHRRRRRRPPRVLAPRAAGNANLLRPRGPRCKPRWASASRETDGCENKLTPCGRGGPRCCAPRRGPHITACAPPEQADPPCSKWACACKCRRRGRVRRSAPPARPRSTRRCCSWRPSASRCV